MVWYFLAAMWIVPIAFYYIDTSASVARRGPFIDVNTRYLSPYFALFTIQGLVVIQKITTHFRKIHFFLAVLVVWDLLHINKTHIWEVAVLYPFMLLVILLVLILSALAVMGIKWFATKEKTPLISTGAGPSRLSGSITRRGVAYVLIFISHWRTLPPSNLS